MIASFKSNAPKAFETLCKMVCKQQLSRDSSRHVQEAGGVS